MNFIRQHVIPWFTLLLALLALVVVSARSFIPSGLASPAPSGVSVIVK